MKVFFFFLSMNNRILHGVSKSQTQLSDFPFTFRFHALETEMATHCSVLAPMISGLRRWLSGKESAYPCRRLGFNPWVGKIPWRRNWQPTPVFLIGKSHGQRSLDAHGVEKESDMTERLHFHFSLSCIGDGNGNPLQCSRLENPRNGGAWWAAVYRVVQSWTRLKCLSSLVLS